ncbi:MAG TPA: DUF2795 domain-containing protein, partial [Candidatus Paceibacterota bacterium]|nr:DUF2795 domain-containing protein [Candidatus Paceibacterota bacterium]
MANDTSPIDIQKYLKGVNYPCSKQELVEAAKREGAPENVLGVLNAMK